jgi:type IV secretory pathway component VirB8
MLSSREKEMIARLEAMPIEQARIKLASGTFGAVGSQSHDFATSWLAVKEAEERDKRDTWIESISRKALFNSRIANIIAIAAIVFSVITAIAIALMVKR